LARFRTEAEAVARLQHPNVVQIHEVGEHGGLPFFLLEFCAGGSLEKKLAGTPLPPQEAARLVQTLAGAMSMSSEKRSIRPQPFDRLVPPLKMTLSPAAATMIRSASVT
jgi:serine/threonine-protein kinase